MMIRPNMEVVVSLVHLFFNKTTKVLLFSAPSICRSKSSHSDLELEKKVQYKEKKGPGKEKMGWNQFLVKKSCQNLDDGSVSALRSQ